MCLFIFRSKEVWDKYVVGNEYPTPRNAYAKTSSYSIRDWSPIGSERDLRLTYRGRIYKILAQDSNCVLIRGGG